MSAREWLGNPRLGQDPHARGKRQDAGHARRFGLFGRSVDQPCMFVTRCQDDALNPASALPVQSQPFGSDHWPCPA